MRRIYYGKAGHFCASNDCRFHIHTHVGGYCISTVGDYRPKDAKGKQEALTADPLALYETMAFRLEADGDINASKPLTVRHYATPEAAEVGHEAAVQTCEAKAIDDLVRAEVQP